VCECERSNDVNLGPVMALMSGPTVGDAISDPNNAIAKLTAEIKDDKQLVDAVFIRILNRHATREGNQMPRSKAWPDSMPSTKHSPPSLQAKEAEQKPVIAKAEQSASLAIEAAEDRTRSLQSQNGPRSEEKEAARLAAIKKAEAKVKAAFDTAPPSSRNGKTTSI
jgi:hypothetical protein